MKQRIITGVIGGIIFITLVYLGDIWYSGLIFLLALIGLFEFLRMAKIPPFSVPGLLSYLLMGGTLWPYLFFGAQVPINFSSLLMSILLLLLFYSVLRKNEFHIEHVALTILGALYIGYGFQYMAAMRQEATGGSFWLTMLILLGIWSTDSGAYFVGRSMGKTKLWPAISPNKTVEGSIGGLFIAMLIVVGVNQLLIWNHVSGALPFVQALGIAFVTGIVAQMGDLVESGMKRHFGVKDSGQIIPGHGGVLDRFDSLLIVFPTLYLLGLS
ncbi:phosphatidate cytidylyltransferase [Brevibacillus dissolubilis]|uniref:phosphatidate cytidylyltransferase n=1 Tax=Brevibacillus dissolubilis TaxID=1844116 RepID=UPI0011177E4C|nr:phosphatidate cytidylyltransferase [Brevibacillus dissolubilis]